MRVNFGCGSHPLLNWVNIDNSKSAYVDIRANCLSTPFRDESLDEVFAGHLIEHFDQQEVVEFLQECRRVLKPGGKLGVVVPDTREIVRRYLDKTAHARVEYPLGKMNDLHDLDAVCSLFFYSTAQESFHKWSYDWDTLTRLVSAHGFGFTADINRWMDERIPVGAWYQFGVDFVKV